MNKKKDYTIETEVVELTETLVEIDVQYLAEMISGDSHVNCPLISEKKTDQNGQPTFWINTPMGFAKVVRFFAQVTEELIIDENPNPNEIN